MGPHAAAVFPGLLEICADADKLSKTLVRDWLQMYMFKGLPNGAELAEKAADFFADTERQSLTVVASPGNSSGLTSLSWLLRTWKTTPLCRIQCSRSTTLSPTPLLVAAL